MTFEDDALVRAVEVAKREGPGTVLFFPRGVYRIADGRQVAIRDCCDVTFYGPEAILRNDTTSRNDGAVLVFEGSTENVTFEGLTIEAATSSPNGYDNALVFYARPPDRILNVRLRNCTFSRASNKAVHLDGPAAGVTVEGCIFRESHFNSNPLPGPSRFGAIFFASYERFLVDGVTIRHNLFADQWLFAISLDQYDFSDGQHYFRRVRVLDNRFVRCTGAVWIRGAHVWIERNVFDRVGPGNLRRRYTLDPTLGRYLSWHRRAARQGALLRNTVLPQRAAVVQTNNANEVWIRDNTFINCQPLQTGMTATASGQLYVAADHARSVTVTGNLAYEDSTLDEPEYPFGCRSADGPEWICRGNLVRRGRIPPDARYSVNDAHPVDSTVRC